VVSDLVTGEAVVLELRLAKLASRGLALLIDVTVQLFLLFFGVLLMTGLLVAVDPVLGTALGLVATIAVLVGYPVTLETLTRGRTLGKLALGLRVVRDDGGPIRFRHAFVRGLLGLVEVWISWFSIALIASLASKRGKRLGDLLAGTVVVHERVPVQGAPVALMPPPLTGWAAGLDLSRVPDDLALASRQYLTRMNQLSPEVQAQMGARLADALTAVIAPPPPPGVPPWALLAAVIAERRRRETLRMGWSAGPPQSGTRGQGVSSGTPSVDNHASSARPVAPGEPQPGFAPPS
jgi:uncharacterized RDD family membrane protein YckC